MKNSSLKFATRRAAFLLAIPALAWTSACSGGSDESDNKDDGHDHDGECGGHGELHDDHCDCDSGYVPDPDDELTCIEEDETSGGSGGTDGMGGSGNNDDEESAGARLAISDADEGLVTVIDLEDGSVVDSFELDGPGRIYATESGRFLGIIQGEANTVSFLDSGLILEEHGDHFDRLTNDPTLLDYEVSGDDLSTSNPVHFVSHSGYITLHFDGEWDEAEEDHILSQNVILAESSLLESSPEPHLVIETAPQHGVSVVTESGHVIITEPSLDREVSSLPSGVSVRDLESGDVLQTFNDGEDFEASCWGLHGEAVLGSDVLFGCHQESDGGALLISWDDSEEEFVSSKMPYPGYPDAPERTSVVASHPKSDYIVGQWGTFAYPMNFYDGLVRISPDDDEVLAANTLELGEVYCSFGFERTDGELVAALTRDGKLHVVDVEDWEIVGTLNVVEDLSEDEACAGSLTMGQGVAYVSEAATGEVHEVDLEDLEVARTFDVGGTPSGMALLGYFGVPGVPAH